MPVVFKINYKDDIRRISLDRAPSYEEIKQIVKQLFNIGPSFVIKYEDDEKDQITIASEGELVEALNVSAKHFSGILRLFVLDKTTNSEVGAPQSIPANPLSSLFAHAASGGTQDVASILSKLQGVELSNAGQQQSLQTLTQLMTAFPWLNETMTAVIKQGLVPPAAGTTNPLADKVPASLPLSKPKQRYLAKFIKDMSIMDGTVFAPNTKFTKTWRVRNEGMTSWPEKTVLLHVGGDQLAATNMVVVPATEPGQEVDISVEMNTPSLPGRYNSFWRLCGAEGNKFGHRMWVDITVKAQPEVVQPAVVVPPVEQVELVVVPPPVVPQEQPEPVVAPPSPAVVEQVPASPEAYVESNKNEKVDEKTDDKSTTAAEVVALGTLVDMGFVGDLLSVLRKHSGDLMGALGELVGNN